MYFDVIILLGESSTIACSIVLCEPFRSEETISAGGRHCGMERNWFMRYSSLAGPRRCQMPDAGHPLAKGDSHASSYLNLLYMGFGSHACMHANHHAIQLFMA